MTGLQINIYLLASHHPQIKKYVAVNKFVTQGK